MARAGSAARARQRRGRPGAARRGGHLRPRRDDRDRRVALPGAVRDRARGRGRGGGRGRRRHLVQTRRPRDRPVPGLVRDLPACLAGRTGNCSTVPWGSTYGFGFGDAYWGGFLADTVRVPYADHMLVPLPAGVPVEAAASASDNIPDGFRTVSMLRDQWPGAPVLVVGGAGPGSIGLYAVGHAIALGAERVLYVDEDEHGAGSPSGSVPRPWPRCRTGSARASRSPSTRVPARAASSWPCARPPPTAPARARASTSTPARCRASRCSRCTCATRRS